jgi:hypothetical protein
MGCMTFFPPQTIGAFLSAAYISIIQWMYIMVKWMNFTFIWWVYYGGMEMALSGLD